MHGTCWYGAACNNRREPFAEVCCSDWVVYGICQDRTCPFYHREPEGEPLSFLSRQVSVEEFKRASNKQRRVYYWGEQGVIFSGFWRLNGDFHTFKSGRPDLYLKCGLTCGTRTTGTPWTRSTRNDKRALDFQRTQPRRHFDEEGQVRPEVNPHPRTYSVRYTFDILKQWTEYNYHIWISRDDLTMVTTSILNPYNYSFDSIRFVFRDASIRETLEVLLSVEGFVASAAHSRIVPPAESHSDATQIARKRTANKARLLRLPNALCFDWDEQLLQARQKAIESDDDAGRAWDTALQNVMADFLSARYKADWTALPELENPKRPWYGGYIWSFWQKEEYGGVPYHYQHPFNLFETTYPTLDEEAVRNQTDPRSDLRTRGTSVTLPRFGGVPNLDLSELCVDISRYAHSIGMTRPVHLRHRLIGHPYDVFARLTRADYKSKLQTTLGTAP